MEKIFLILICLALILFFLTPRTDKNHQIKIKINQSIIDAEVADNPLARYRGLSNRPDLCEKCGMLFVFPIKVTQIFSMRRMIFPLDIIWLDGNKIIKIDKNLLPEDADYKHTYSSSAPSNRVLEVNAGFCDKNNINVNDEITIYPK
jgi:hypothetical protein